MEAAKGDGYNRLLNATRTHVTFASMLCCYQCNLCTQVLDAMAAKAKGDSARIAVCRFKSGGKPPPVGLDLPEAKPVMPSSRPAAEVSEPQFTFNFFI